MVSCYDIMIKDWTNPLVQWYGGDYVNITIDKKNGIPLYIQVKGQIMFLIKKGTLRIVYKMPTERELAKQLGVSRNTISTAYNDLENNGVLKSIRGKGTFVAEEVTSWKNDDYRKKLYKFVDLALEESLECGITLEDFLEMVTERVNEKKNVIGKMTSAFIECNEEQAKMFSKEITTKTGMNTIPLTLKDLEIMNMETKEKLAKCQVIISPFNHINDVKEHLKDVNKEILGVEINLNLGSLVRIARHPINTTFAFICLSEEFIFKIKAALEESGIGDLAVNYYNGIDEVALKKVIDSAEVLIVTPGRYKDVHKLNVDNKELIEFSYTLDSTSVKTLRSKFVELKCQII